MFRVKKIKIQVQYEKFNLLNKKKIEYFYKQHKFHNWLNKNIIELNRSF